MFVGPSHRSQHLLCYGLQIYAVKDFFLSILFPMIQIGGTNPVG